MMVFIAEGGGQVPARAMGWRRAPGAPAPVQPASGRSTGSASLYSPGKAEEEEEGGEGRAPAERLSPSGRGGEEALVPGGAARCMGWGFGGDKAGGSLTPSARCFPPCFPPPHRTVGENLPDHPLVMGLVRCHGIIES